MVIKWRLGIQMIDLDYDGSFKKMLDEKTLTKANRDKQTHDYLLIVKTIKQCVTDGTTINHQIGDALGCIVDDLLYYKIAQPSNTYSIHIPLEVIGYDRGSASALVSAMIRRRKKDK